MNQYLHSQMMKLAALIGIGIPLLLAKEKVISEDAGMYLAFGAFGIAMGYIMLRRSN